MNQPIAYLGRNTLLTMTKFGRKIYVDGRDLSLAPHLLMQGDWESWITAFVRRRLLAREDEPGALILDVGANVGWYSLVAYFTKEAHYEVRAFEPNPRLAELLRKTFNVNGLPEAWVREVAVGVASGGIARLGWSDDCMGGGAVLHEAHGRRHIADVEQVALDQELASQRVAMMKIDVEGYEPQVLWGAKEIIAQNPTIEILTEHTPREAERQVLEELTADGFKLGYIDKQGNPQRHTVDEAMELPPAEMLYLSRC